jgi:hypothetical protein
VKRLTGRFGMIARNIRRIEKKIFDGRSWLRVSWCSTEHERQIIFISLCLQSPANKYSDRSLEDFQVLA